MPLGAVLPLAFFVLVTLVCGQRQFGDSRALRREFDLGIFAEIAEQSNFVYAFSCHESSLNLGQWVWVSGRISTNISVLARAGAKMQAVSFESERARVALFPQSLSYCYFHHENHTFSLSCCSG